MAEQGSWDSGTRTWRIAAIVAAGAMVAWLGWHAVSATHTLGHLQDSHAEAAAVKAELWALEAELQRTAQLAIATGEGTWTDQHLESEAQLRDLLVGLLADDLPGEDSLRDALDALEEMSRIEAGAAALRQEGRHAEALGIVTGDEYLAALAALSRAINQFDAAHHAWLLDEELGLTRGELSSLVGALVLFIVAIAVWLFLLRRLERDKALVEAEIAARRRAEGELLEAEKLKLLGQLAGTVAHDFDNVLAALSGYAGMLRDESRRERALAGLERAIQQGEEMTDNLLGLLRGEEPGRRPVELGALLSELRDWLEPLLPARIRLDLEDYANGELWVDADPGQLRQAVVNLALNGRDAMPDGGVLRLVLCRRGAAPGCEPEADGFACLSVIDTGVGMDEETLRRAGQPLFTTKGPGRGTGLGLGSVERFVEGHGGRLEINSAPGGGTRVRLLLPRHTA